MIPFLDELELKKLSERIRKKNPNVKLILNANWYHLEKFAKNLDLNSKDEYSMVLTNIVPDDKNIALIFLKF